MTPLSLARRLLPLLGLGAIALAGCGGDDGGPDTHALTLALAGGNGQQGVPGEGLAEPFAVRVTDGAGAPVPEVTVSWSVVSGGGSIAASSTTGQDGVATASYTVGPALGQQRVDAAVSGATGSPVSFTVTAVAAAPGLRIVGGNNQSGPAGSALPLPLVIEARNDAGAPLTGATVTWAVTAGGGQLSATSTTTGDNGRSSVSYTLGPDGGANTVTASVDGLPGSPVTFTLTATAELVVAGGGNNVPERFGSDLWVQDGYAYTGTWGFRSQPGNAVKVWRLDANGAPTLVNTVVVSGISAVSDVQVSPDGSLLVFTAEGGPNAGLHVYGLADPANPTHIANHQVSTGLHTGTLAAVGGKLYAFTAKNPSGAALLIYDLSNPASPTVVKSQAIPEHYGLHDTFVRDGIVFAFAWNTGVIIYDIGGGGRGGSPSNPVEISRIVTGSGEVREPAVHNGWWFHNPNTGEKRYLFVGQEGSGSIGSTSSGDIRVVDVSDLAHPVEVGFYRMRDDRRNMVAGAHNFWMDEEKEILYAAFYNGGVVALDVSGTLSGDLAARELARVQPGGAQNTYTWGVQLSDGSLYASDMESGLWQLRPSGL
ncbi:MAG TPA: Ig-like domain-containing protein [Gemmatimonadales bacterium]|nr:Ig-like domain-containing protein [Gemmatimonadales bacterium]